jgi:hypothetical protein
MKNKILFLVLIGAALTSGEVLAADDLNWTNEQRVENRDAVIAGEVLDVQTVTKLAGGENLNIAQIQIDKIFKKHKLVQGKSVSVYFISGETDFEGYINLKKGQSADFYLDARPLFQNRDVFFLDFASDVRKRGSLKN